MKNLPLFSASFKHPWFWACWGAKVLGLYHITNDVLLEVGLLDVGGSNWWYIV